jgi:septal ring factor EnvC (AmiA/AmiB activator)
VPRTKSIADLEQELAKKKRDLEELQTQRQLLASELADVESQIAKLQGEPKQPQAEEPKPAPRKRRVRQRGWSNLGDALAAVLAGAGEVGARDAAQMVQDAGYRTTAKTFGATVSRALAADPRFHRVSRGVYVAIGGK